jgi:hypothetical protein
MLAKKILFVIIVSIVSLIALSGSVLAATGGNSTSHEGTNESIDHFMAAIILSGVFLIAGGITATSVRRDISKRNMIMTKWISLLILFTMVIPIAVTFAIMYYKQVTTFYGFFALFTSYLSFIALYIYFRGQSVLLVRNVPAEFVVKLNPAYKEILAFGIVIFGLLITVIGFYQLNTGNTDVGKPVSAIGISTAIIGVVLIKLWFSTDRLVIDMSEIRIKRGKKVEKVAWSDVESIIFFKELSHLLNIELGSYHKRVGPSGSQRSVEIIAGDRRLKFMDSEIPSYEDFRILFFILLHHRSIANPDTKVYFQSTWAKGWYRDYRRHMMQAG